MGEVARLKPDTKPDFNRFWHYWKAMDRNVDRRECLRLFEGITSPKGVEVCIVRKDGTKGMDHLQATPAELVAGARSYFDRMERTKTEAKFIRTPAVWLRHAGWEDEL